ncbi:hypothetical protein ES703_124811 [subsurface metagenome]
MVDFNEHMTPGLNEVFQPPPMGQASDKGFADVLAVVIRELNDRDSGLFHVFYYMQERD